MRYLYAAVVLLVDQVAVATPIIHVGMDLISYSANPQYDAVTNLDPRELQKRFTCQALNHVIRTIGTSKNT